MCGIAGVYNVAGEPPDTETLASMAQAIAHRGPDAERFHVEGGLGLAHRHLRIIDLSDAALQPMSNEDGSVWIVYNGEVYNYVELRPELEARGHRFASHSDTEVIVRAYEEWGLDCLRRFNGMFAFALWDRKRERLFLARDRMGVKPLYYRWDGRTLVFGSEIKALLAHTQATVRPNLTAIAEYMSAMYTAGGHTWFEGIERLLPGHYLLVERAGLSVRQWWDLPADEDPPGARPESDYAEEARAILEDSVRLRLRSDVPLGSHLSGGIDSSAVVALLSKQLAPSGERVRTFSGAFAEGPSYDERRYVRLVVQRYKTEQRETIPGATDLSRLMDDMTWHMDEPAAGPGILLQWAVCELTRRSGVIVINGGQGGDEAWAGYFGYIPAYFRTLLRQVRRHPALASQVLADAATTLRRPSTRAALVRALSSGRRGRLVAEAGSGPWAGPAFDGFLTEPTSGGSGTTAGRTPLGAATYRDIKWYLPALLQVEDRTSMAFSLESRAPLLDYRLIELSARVPSAYKMRGLETKRVLREAVRDLLPPPIYRRRDKMGMPTPVALWFRGPLAGWLREELLGPGSLAGGALSKEYAEQAMAEHLSGKKDRSVDLWKMLSVAAWWRVFVDGQRPERAGAGVEHERPASLQAG